MTNNSLFVTRRLLALTLEIQASEPSSTAPLIEAHKPVPTVDCPHFIPAGWRNVVIYNGGRPVEKPKDPQKKKSKEKVRYVVPKTTA